MLNPSASRIAAAGAVRLATRNPATRRVPFSACLWGKIPRPVSRWHSTQASTLASTDALADAAVNISPLFPHLRPESSEPTRAAAAASAAVPDHDPESGPQGPDSSAKTLAKTSEARLNEINIQQLSDHMFRQVFPNDPRPPLPELVELAKDHLKSHYLLGKNTDNSLPIAFDIPELQGDSKTLDEHFFRLGTDCAEPFLTMAKAFSLETLPPKPASWVRRSGWTMYPKEGPDPAEPPVPVPVAAPLEQTLCFDVEVMWKESPYAVMACAASAKAWYAWISPWLLGDSEYRSHLVPLGDPAVDRVIVGHNVGYDRARTLEEYDLGQTRNAFLDTMSLHAAVNGMCSRQRPTWMKYKKNLEMKERIAAAEESDVAVAALLRSASGSLPEDEHELWVERSSINSLRDVAKLHLQLSVDKSARNDFAVMSQDEIVAKLDDLLLYCAADVDVTHRVYKKVLVSFLERCPHPVSFAALRHLSSVILPVDRSWDGYISRAEAKYRELSAAVQERLIKLAEVALGSKDNPELLSKDPWLSQLDWTGQEIKMTKPKKKGDEPRPFKRQKMPGKPQWYKDLYPKLGGPISLSVRTRLAPLLLKLSWEGHPLVWSDQYGWTFRVPAEQSDPVPNSQALLCDMTTEPIEKLRSDRGGTYYKLPHKDGPQARCANPLAKSYLAYFESDTLTSKYPYAKEALEMNASCSYWISARDRIMSQMVVYAGDVAVSKQHKLDPATAPESPDHEQVRTDAKALLRIEEDTNKPHHENTTTTHQDQQLEQGFILPQVIPMGTITRRAVENTWLTASNAKPNRVGSELKAMVRAPAGYSFVGADVDSEELWIASLVGDAVFQLHGGNALGFMTLEGTRAAGTDLHSRTADILGISRNNAKVFNYGRIYGAGLRFATTLLRQFNPSMSEADTAETATKLYAATKGTKATRRPTLWPRSFWRGGTESLVFNKLEEFAQLEHPRTPVLGAGITEALNRLYISKGGYLPSRINWAIQSSGVDYLHLLIVSMDYLIRRFHIKARLAITVHDEIRYLVLDEDRYRAAMALQVSNLWTRAMFSQQVGIDDLPQSCAFFSAVDVDRVLRKEVDMPCVTPSSPDPIPAGESLDVAALLALGNKAYLDPKQDPVPRFGPNPCRKEIVYKPRVPVMETLRQSLASSGSGPNTAFLRAQMAKDEDEIRDIVKEEQRRIDEQNKKAVAERGEAQLRESKYRSTVNYRSTPELLPVMEPARGGEVWAKSGPGGGGGTVERGAGGGMSAVWEWKRATAAEAEAVRRAGEGGVWNTEI